MTKKIISLTLVLMIIFSMSAFVVDVKANTQNNNVVNETSNNNVDKVQNQENILDKSTENALNETNQGKDSNNKTNSENSVQNVPRGKAQYTVVEAPEAIEEKNIVENTNKRIIDPTKPMIAITFDDGPSQYTPGVLDVLKENNSAATFFVLGLEIHKHEDVLNRMIAEGNQIGNHTYNHKKLTTISDEELYKQIKGTDDLVYIATGYTPSVMRPPYGATSEELNKKISKPIINWSIDTRDWESRNVEMITNSILKDVKDGDIVLMHDIYDSTLEASKIVIPELVKRGFQLVTIDELFEHRDATLVAGQVYRNIYKK